MPQTSDDGPAIYYETSGDARGEPIVLIAGASVQLIWWRDGFVQRLVDRGMFVIRLDNRDMGLSEKIGGPTDLAPTYGIPDMAGDVCRVLDALGIVSAHIAGQSLGGGIAAAMAIHHAERVRSLVLFYTLPRLAPEYLTDEFQQLVQSPPSADFSLSREEAIAGIVALARSTSSTDYAFDEAWIREYAERAYDRCFCPEGLVRQIGGALGSWNPSDADIGKLTMPTTMIHGRADRSLKAEASIELGRLIPNSELHIYPGLGHELAEPLWDEFATIIARTIARAPR